MVTDRCVLAFLATEQHLKAFLVELGLCFAFVGRQYRLKVGRQDFYAVRVNAGPPSDLGEDLPTSERLERVPHAGSPEGGKDIS